MIQLINATQGAHYLSVGSLYLVQKTIFAFVKLLPEKPQPCATFFNDGRVAPGSGFIILQKRFDIFLDCSFMAGSVLDDACKSA